MQRLSGFGAPVTAQVLAGPTPFSRSVLVSSSRKAVRPASDPLSPKLKLPITVLAWTLFTAAFFIPAALTAARRVLRSWELAFPRRTAR